jgi:nitrate reductase alpha subunit
VSLEEYISLIGGTCLSFYDWYCDLPPASPQTWGEQTDVPESAEETEHASPAPK